MARTRIAIKKQMDIGRFVINGDINIRQTSRRLGISRNTVKSYVKKYRELANDQHITADFMIPVLKASMNAKQRLHYILTPGTIILSSTLKRREIKYGVKNWLLLLLKIPTIVRIQDLDERTDAKVSAEIKCVQSARRGSFSNPFLEDLRLLAAS